MPPLTRLFLRISLIWFGLSLLVGLVLAANAVWDLPPIVGVLNPVFFHLFLVGWVTQLIFGVAYWMFPKFTVEKPRGHEDLAWATFWLLNIGLSLRAIGEPMQALQPSALWGWALATAALLQWAAGLLFVFNTWGRVKER